MSIKSESHQRIKNFPDKRCKCCGKKLHLINRRDFYRKKFCSHACAGKYMCSKRMKERPDLIEKFWRSGNTLEANTKKGHSGSDNPNWQGGPIRRKCLWCKQEFSYRRDKSRNAKYCKYCSRECYLAHHKTGFRKIPKVEFTCERCRKTIMVKRCRLSNHGKPRRFCSNRCAGAYALDCIKTEGTSIENALEDILKSIGVDFLKQKWLIGITKCDFFVKPNYAVYADGDYWHNLPEVAERDRLTNSKLEKSGFKVIRFSEYQICNNPKLVESEIRKELNMPPSVSTSQQRAAGMARAAQEGKIPMSHLHGPAREMAKMPAKSLSEFAKTRHGNLPEHVAKHSK